MGKAEGAVVSPSPALERAAWEPLWVTVGQGLQGWRCVFLACRPGCTSYPSVPLAGGSGL